MSWLGKFKPQSFSEWRPLTRIYYPGDFITFYNFLWCIFHHSKYRNHIGSCNLNNPRELVLRHLCYFSYLHSPHLERERSKRENSKKSTFVKSFLEWSLFGSFFFNLRVFRLMSCDWLFELSKRGYLCVVCPKYNGLANFVWKLRIPQVTANTSVRWVQKMCFHFYDGTYNGHRFFSRKGSIVNSMYENCQIVFCT